MNVKLSLLSRSRRQLQSGHTTDPVNTDGSSTGAQRGAIAVGFTLTYASPAAATAARAGELAALVDEDSGSGTSAASATTVSAAARATVLDELREDLVHSLND